MVGGARVTADVCRMMTDRAAGAYTDFMGEVIVPAATPLWRPLSSWFTAVRI